MIERERIVYDTNVWISGLLWRGAPHQCVLLARAGLVCPVYCPSMLEELLEKLEKVFRFDLEDLRRIHQEVAEMGECVEIVGNLRVVQADPDDDKFVESAIKSKASVIVSGDKHLLRLGSYEGIRVLTPREYLRHLEEK